MILGVLAAGLVALLAGAWLFVEAISFLHAGRRAFERYVDTHPDHLAPAVPVHPRTETPVRSVTGRKYPGQ